MKVKGTKRNDIIDGGRDADQIRGLAGDDLLSGGGGNDILRGDAGADTLNGGLGSDRLLGGADDDTLIDDSGGSDTLYGGSGADRLTVTRTNHASTDSLKLYGEDGADQITFSGRNTSGVAALLSGGVGDDTIVSDGAATIDGAGGHDTILLDRFAAWSIVDAGEGDDRVTLANYLSESNTISLGKGNDIFDANQCGFSVSGGDGDDIFSTLNARGGVIRAGSGNDTVRANNSEFGGLRVDAGSGDDLVSINTSSSGTSHKVTLGDGEDTLELRADNFLYDANITVTDFITGRDGDKLRLADYLEKTLVNYDGGDPFASGHLRLIQQKSSALLQIDNDGGSDGWRTIVTFEDARASAFRTANFEDDFDPQLFVQSTEHSSVAHPDVLGDIAI